MLDQEITRLKQSLAELGFGPPDCSDALQFLAWLQAQFDKWGIGDDFRDFSMIWPTNDANLSARVMGKNLDYFQIWGTRRIIASSSSPFFDDAHVRFKEAGLLLHGSTMYGAYLVSDLSRPIGDRISFVDFDAFTEFPHVDVRGQLLPVSMSLTELLILAKVDPTNAMFK